MVGWLYSTKRDVLSYIYIYMGLRLCMFVYEKAIGVDINVCV